MPQNLEQLKKGQVVYFLKYDSLREWVKAKYIGGGLVVFNGSYFDLNDFKWKIIE